MRENKKGIGKIQTSIYIFFLVMSRKKMLIQYFWLAFLSIPSTLVRRLRAALEWKDYSQSRHASKSTIIVNQ